MQVKALDHIEDVSQIPEPDGNGGYTLRTIVTQMTAGETYELDDAQAKRLKDKGLVSDDLNSPLLSHLIPSERT